MRYESDTVPDAVPPWAEEGEQRSLEEHLRRGIALREDRAAVRRRLWLAVDADDLEVARALVRRLTAAEVTAVTVTRDRAHDPRRSQVPPPDAAADSSLLGQLRSGRDPDRKSIDVIDDPRTLVAVIHGGELRQRRAAMYRLGEVLAERKGEGVRDAAAALDENRDVDLAYERAVARSKLGGAIGREARAERDAWNALVASLEPAIRAFWDGDRLDEPVAALPGDQRAQLLMRVRDLPDVVVDHLSAVVEGADGVLDRAGRRSLLSSLRHAGDPRLVPSLRSVLEGDEPEIAIEAALALARIDDPRVRPALAAAYERSVLEREKAILAGALGAVGDRRGLEYVRERLATDDASVVVAALGALASLGSTEDCEKVVAFLDHEDPPVVARAVRTLGRIGDVRALVPLARLRKRTQVSALWARVEDAVMAIRSRMELRGESVDASLVGFPLEEASPLALAERGPFRVRWAALRELAVGRLWLLLGNVRRAVGRFESASVRRPGWAPPLLAIAMAFARRGRYGQALTAFRRAIEADRARVERTQTYVRALALSFLRRAEEMERQGRRDIARGLLDEALVLDLRRAPSALQFELKRRQEALRGDREAA